MKQSLITAETLDEFDINLADQDVKSLLNHLNTTLEERIGSEITTALNDTQLAELAELQETATDEVIASWLEHAVPELQQITQDEIDILLGELADSSRTINQVV